MLKLSEVRSILREYNIRPSKRLGQNFLIDQNIKDKIINSIEVGKENTVLEIGPGLGTLTQDLCKKAERVIAVEKDKRLYDFLTKNLSWGNLELINDDILKYEFENLSSKLIIVGNLPYSISSPILNHLINNRDYISSIYITVQAEFGQRLVASPGTKDYSSLSCYAQFYTEPNTLFNIPKRAFYPVPEVDSCFMRMNIRKDKPYEVDEERLFKIIRASFSKRRKTILNSLSSSGIFKSKEEALTTKSTLPSELRSLAFNQDPKLTLVSSPVIVSSADVTASGYTLVPSL